MSRAPIRSSATSSDDPYSPDPSGNTGEEAPAPLAGITVLDLSHFVAGPWCTMLLADLGAKVVKVEPPGTGEIGRQMGGVYSAGESAIFLGFNRNKRSVALDLKHEEGQRVVARLAEHCDVAVHNFRPETARRLGVDDVRLRSVNPRLIHCAISAFGKDGPYATRAANDPIIQAISGAMLTGERSTGTPVRMGVSLPDFGAGVLAATAITSAVYRRQRTGQGCVLDLNLLDVEMFAQLDLLQPLLCPESGGARPRDRTSPYSGIYRCRDECYLYLDVADEEVAHRVARLLANERTVPDRSSSSAFLSRDRSEWLQRLEKAEVPCASVNTLSEMSSGGKKVSLTVQHSLIGDLDLMRTPISAHPSWPIRRCPPPRLGEHTADVLAELGYDAESIAEMSARGIAATNSAGDSAR